MRFSDRCACNLDLIVAVSGIFGLAMCVPPICESYKIQWLDWSLIDVPLHNAKGLAPASLDEVVPWMPPLYDASPGIRAPLKGSPGSGLHEKSTF